MARQKKKERAARAFRQAAAKSAASEADRGAAEVERRARVQRRAAKLLHAAKMPARMEMLQKQKKQQQGGAGGLRGKEGGKEEHFQMKLNKISSMDGHDIKKYFERSQLKFKKSLQQAKQSRQCTHSLYLNIIVCLLAAAASYCVSIGNP